MTREMLEAVPELDLAEMPRTRENALCCGAGRGTVFAFPELAKFAAKDRIREAKSVGAEILVAACPWCHENFSSVKDEGDRSLRLLDITELLLEASKK
jgi:Fe-S oxidoreductase